MTVSELKDKCGLCEKLGLGNAEIEIFIDKAAILSIEDFGVDMADDVYIHAKSNEELIRWIKNK